MKRPVVLLQGYREPACQALPLLFTFKMFSRYQKNRHLNFYSLTAMYKCECNYVIIPALAKSSRVKFHLPRPLSIVRCGVEILNNIPHLHGIAMGQLITLALPRKILATNLKNVLYIAFTKFFIEIYVGKNTIPDIFWHIIIFKRKNGLRIIYDGWLLKWNI